MGIELADGRTQALLQPAALIEDADALAAMRIRRLANRHGCTLRITGRRLTGECPDLEAHNRDVAVMTTVLQAAGLAASETGNRQRTSRGSR